MVKSEKVVGERVFEELLNAGNNLCEKMNSKKRVSGLIYMKVETGGSVPLNCLAVA